MARTGTFGGFDFDKEVFAEYMQEQPLYNTNIIASGIVAESPSIMSLIGTKGNVATIPFYKEITIDDYAPKNNDGETDNTPETISGGKQTCMLIQRMKAWKAQDFTKELTGADPMQHMANAVTGYYQQVWQHELMTIADAILSLDAMSSHVYNLTTVANNKNKTGFADETSLMYAQEAAFGDTDNRTGLIVLNSKIMAAYKALKLVEYDRYTATDALGREVTLPSIGGMVALVNNKYTASKETVGSKADTVVYKTYTFGTGCFVGATKTNYEEPYYTDYDPETKAGVEMLYTKQGRVLHPNGFSLAVDNIAKESPTTTELGTKANWSLKWNAENIRMGVMKTLG